MGSPSHNRSVKNSAPVGGLINVLSMICREGAILAHVASGKWQVASGCFAHFMRLSKLLIVELSMRFISSAKAMRFLTTSLGIQCRIRL